MMPVSSRGCFIVWLHRNAMPQAQGSNSSHIINTQDQLHMLSINVQATLEPELPISTSCVSPDQVIIFLTYKKQCFTLFTLLSTFIKLISL